MSDHQCLWGLKQYGVNMGSQVTGMVEVSLVSFLPHNVNTGFPKDSQQVCVPEIFSNKTRHIQMLKM